MCNRFKVTATLAKLTEHFAATTQKPFKWGGEILPGGLVPGLIRNADGERELVPMRFAFCPPGKDPAEKNFQPNNARVEKRGSWPWLGSFKKYRCIVPLTSFREPSYWGEPAGCEISFTPTDNRVLGVAALYNEVPYNDGMLMTMALLMRPASQYVMDCGHHRQPLFIEPDGYDAWLGEGERDAKESHAILHEFAIEPNLTYAVARSMAESWTSRQPKKLEKRDEQLEDMSW